MPRSRTLRRILHPLTGLGTAIALALAVLGAAPAAAAAGQQDATRIMPLGDSITGSPGCWRALLWDALRESGHTGLDFVGTLPPQGCGIDHDGDNEGHGGYLVTNVANQGLLVGWLQATDPDVVLMHFGTNDVWSGIPTATILDAYGTLVAQMRAHNSEMRILVAQIIPMDPARSCAGCGDGVQRLNAAIPDWAAAENTPESPVIVVDQWTGFDTGAHTYDGVHPNAAGDRLIAERWFPALTSVLG
ncbi:SGNH/GDSL hydrolase family protein [Marinactinospora rubrisoli]|uniref:SGNH/GDSL hydrolase family protein n=1 Tax=Marinactinospora rubrisoli TaxID=2715399 RepID=A0ABW2KKZ9_9ACTN